jgi:hypothetical protein
VTVEDHHRERVTDVSVLAGRLVRSVLNHWRVLSYPSVMKNSTSSYVAVTAPVPGTPKARATAAIFAY